MAMLVPDPARPGPLCCLPERAPACIAQIHLSELDARCHHAPLSMASVTAIQEIAHWIERVPVILESRVAEDQIGAELQMAALCFERQHNGH